MPLHVRVTVDRHKPTPPSLPPLTRRARHLAISFSVYLRVFLLPLPLRGAALLIFRCNPVLKVISFIYQSFATSGENSATVVQRIVIRGRRRSSPARLRNVTITRSVSERKKSEFDRGTRFQPLLSANDDSYRNFHPADSPINC